MLLLHRLYRRWSLPVCLLGAVFALPTLPAQKGLAQSTLPACPPPTEQEYLLLVRGATEADRNQIASTLPADNPVLICQYLDEVVVRAGGFTSLETANAWATYMNTVEGFESFVSRYSEAGQTATGSAPPASTAVTTTSTATSPTSHSASSNGAAYQPVRLGAGYAVLVDYGDRPEVAATISQIVRPVGLAVYQQRIYLLADHTGNEASAVTTLQRLSDAQVTATLVDAQQVVRISAEVARF
ncbi:MAG: hypothetical protein WBC73_08795 [Phormidesmis sp.]